MDKSLLSSDTRYLAEMSAASRDAVLGFRADRKAEVYKAVNAQLDGFFLKYPGLDKVAKMATINSFLAAAFSYWHFVGFYVVRKDKEGDCLHIGPYQGKVLATGMWTWWREHIQYLCPS